MNITELAPGLRLFHDVIHVGCLERQDGCALIGVGEGTFLGSAISPASVRQVWLTHHHRDEAAGLAPLLEAGAELWVPAGERALFEDAEGFWSAPARQYHQYNFHPSNLSIRESVPVARGVQDGERFRWGPWEVEVLHTPGHTLGSVSYVVTGRGVRVAFVGDLIYAPGQVWEFHSLQGRLRFPDGSESQEYHGFGERADQLLASLERVLERAPDYLVPSHGVVMDNPKAAVARLRYHLERCLYNYRSTSAGRWYFPTAHADWEVAHPQTHRNRRDLPPWVLEPGGTSRLLRADDGSVFLLDCAGNAPQLIRQLQEAGQIGPVEGVWITHYHDDHVDKVASLRAEQRCPVIVHERMADILRRPSAYLMPCLHHEPIPVDRTVRHGESWEWKGFRLTAYDFPGQSYYDAALGVEREGVSVLFTGDSMTPGGLDDYCAFNRDLLGEEYGYLRCLRLLDDLEPDLLVNQHVPGAFAFSRQQREWMRAQLRERLALFQKLLPWEHPNYGLDPRWIRCDPYAQQGRPGEPMAWTIHVSNYTETVQPVTVEVRFPTAWRLAPTRLEGEAPPHGEAALETSCVVPRDAPPGLAIIGLSVTYGDRPLGEIAEGLLTVEP